MQNGDLLTNNITVLPLGPHEEAANKGICKAPCGITNSAL